MGYIINLLVSPEILAKYNHGMQYGAEQIQEAINSATKLKVCFEDDFEEDNSSSNIKGQQIYLEFNGYLELHNFESPNDDLLYYILCHNYNALTRASNMLDLGLDDKPRRLKHKAKSLAELIIFYNQNPNNYDVNVIFKASSGDTVKVDSKELNEWLNKIIKKAISRADFPLDELVNYMPYLIPGITNRDKILLDSSKVSINDANEAFRQIQTEFLWFIFEYLSEEGLINRKPTAKYPVKALLFLYDIAKLFDWLPASHTAADDADYIRSLFYNYFKRQSKTDK